MWGQIHNTKASIDFSLHLTKSDVGSDRANTQLRNSAGDGFRLSISGASRSSSQSSGPDDCESLGDIYVWGEVWCDGNLGNGSSISSCSKTDVLVPKPLESNVVLDVHQIACGVRHAALVTKQGEVFTWGEESGGQLGHGIYTDFCRPQLVESLAVCNVDYVACGEYHMCAISITGDLYTWGDGTYNAGLLGHGTGVSHCIPKRVSGPLEGLQVLSVACGTWHSALVTSNGKLYTFGDGTFGVLGHGDRKSTTCPKEVESLGGLKSIMVACGVWHTAAIVEVTGQGGINVSSRKLFTWGDGDKYRLGHGDKQTRLVPTCVPSLIDYNFHQLACGHSITVGLTTSGHVITMGSTVYGQLGNPQSDGRLPCLVQDRLVGELVEDIACGAHHVAVLTSRSEVFTWGRGANGRLGHGDIEDRGTPTLIEALKDRHIKSISCGSNFTASICIHKWVSGTDQSMCTGCRQAFGFTRKRHNCYNCGLVHCHACSSKKVLKAALAPTPGKPHRVCDSCYAKLKASEAGNASTTNGMNIVVRHSMDSRERSQRGESRSSKFLISPNSEPVKYFEVNSLKHGVKSDSLSLLRASQIPLLLQLKDVSFPSSLSALQTALKPLVTSAPPPMSNSRPASPYSRKSSPPCSGTPVFSKSIIDSLKKTNELLNQEVIKLQTQVKNLRGKSELQDIELQKSENRAQEVARLAAEGSYKCTAALAVIQSFVAQLKDMAEKLPPEVSNNLRTMHVRAESLLKTYGSHTSEFSSLEMDSSEFGQGTHPEDYRMDNPGNGADSSQNAEGSIQDDSRLVVCDTKEATLCENMENGSRLPMVSTLGNNNDGETELIEQFEHGVYITYVRHRNGTKVFKRVRFSKRRFAEQQAEDWWKGNKARVFKKYHYLGMDTAPSTAFTSAPPAEEEDAAPSSLA